MLDFKHQFSLNIFTGLIMFTVLLTYWMHHGIEWNSSLRFVVEFSRREGLVAVLSAARVPGDVLRVEMVHQ